MTENGKTLNTNSYISVGILVSLILATVWITNHVDDATAEGKKNNDQLSALQVDQKSMAAAAISAKVTADANNARIGKLEDTTGRLIPDVSQIKTDLAWIAEWVREQRAGQDKRKP